MKKLLMLLPLVLLTGCSLSNKATNNDVVSSGTTLETNVDTGGSVSLDALFLNPEICKEKWTRQQAFDDRANNMFGYDTNVIHADYACQYSGFDLEVLDFSKVPGKESVIARGLDELHILGTYPVTMYGKIFAPIAGAGALKSTVELASSFPKVDASRIFIYFVGQELFDPTFKILAKKGTILLSINKCLAPQCLSSSEKLMYPGLQKIFENFQKAQSTFQPIQQGDELLFDEAQTIQYYNTHVANNPEYLKFSTYIHQCS